MTPRDPEPEAVTTEPGPEAEAPDSSQRAVPLPSRAGPRARMNPRVGIMVGAMLLLLVATTVGGIAIGRATASPDRTGLEAAVPSPPPGSSTPTTSAGSVVVREKTPDACDAALTNADAAVSYLVGNIRDQRLSQSMQRYQENRRACREASR
jgi:hypothetical protein